MRELVIREAEAGQRLDKFLRKYMRDAGSGFLYKMLRKKSILLNRRKAAGSELLVPGDRLELFLSEETLTRFGAPGAEGRSGTASAARTDGAALPSGRKQPPAVYEDGDVLILNKPAGMLVQPASGAEPALSDLLPGWLLSRGAVSREDLRAVTPAPVNRLDRNTSGLVLCGKTMAGLQYLSQALRTRDLEKRYLALTVPGSVPDGVYRVYALKDRCANRMKLSDRPESGASEMVTGITVLARSPLCQLVLVRLITGRTHQIRAHLAWLGIPIAGDPKYGLRTADAPLTERYRLTRQMLHAWEVRFPSSAEITALQGRTFRAGPPADFRRVMNGEELRWPEEGG